MFARLCLIALCATALPAQAQAPTQLTALAPLGAEGPVDLAPAPAPAPSDQAVTQSLRPNARDEVLPTARWGKSGRPAIWTRAALSALRAHADDLPGIVPADIADWCPAYPEASREDREAFWVGLVSTLAKYESTYRPRVVGGGGRWYGLLQILPSTARLYDCRAGTGEALKNGPANLSCGLRIMARTVARDGVVSRGMRGVAADWGPFHSRGKRTDMMAWTREQTYCKPLMATRPKPRPRDFL